VRALSLEEGTMGLLIGGISSILGISFILILFLLLSEKRSSFKIAYGFVLIHFVFIGLAAFPALAAMKYDVYHSMASEETSLRLGIAGVLWAISMVFLLLGLVRFSRNKENNGVKKAT
jgi:hypothetical protein